MNITVLWLFALWFTFAVGFVFGALWRGAREEKIDEARSADVAVLYLNAAKAYLGDSMKAGNLKDAEAFSLVAQALSVLHYHDGGRT